ncbi:hypothetical protein, partial [Acinetobacter oleivorans]|uniref:hypothetical protein n=1 Tax=Acinetobacter oleivorans TaxID=1148157 RepID=UPI0015801515
ILAGKPLINFTLEFIKWSFGYSLNSGFGSADREFKNLIRYNSVDWENTRKKLLIDSQSLNSNDTSNVSKSAYIRILYATGETNDQKLGEKIGNQLWSAERHFLFKSRKEKYCSSDPCDPKSSPPEDFIETIKAVNEIDISKIWNNQMQTSEGIFLHDIQTGLARFSSKELVLIYRKLISNILERSI